MRRLTQQEFLFRARQIFGTSYGYEKTLYLDSKQEIIVICPTHGAFKQMPLKHLAGQHCRKCADFRRSRNQAATLEDFLRSAVNKHGEFYDYSHVRYVNRNTDVAIHCPVHGPFHQKAILRARDAMNAEKSHQQPCKPGPTNNSVRAPIPCMGSALTIAGLFTNTARRG